MAGIVGNAINSSRTASANGSNPDPAGALTYRGGSAEANALATVLRDTPNRCAITRPDNLSTRLSRRISAQSSTVITIHLHQVAHYSVGRNGSLFTQHRQPGSLCC